MATRSETLLNNINFLVTHFFSCKFEDLASSKVAASLAHAGDIQIEEDSSFLFFPLLITLGMILIINTSVT